MTSTWVYAKAKEACFNSAESSYLLGKYLVLSCSVTVDLCLRGVEIIQSLAICLATVSTGSSWHLLALSHTATKSIPSASSHPQNAGGDAPVSPIGPEDRAFVEIEYLSAPINRSCFKCAWMFLFPIVPYTLSRRDHPGMHTEIVAAKAQGCFILHNVMTVA